VLCGRVGVRQAAAHRAAVADRHVGHQADRLGQQRRGHGHLGGPLDLGHPGHGPDDQGVALAPDSGQAGHAAQIDQVTRLGQPEVHQRDQALAPGQHPGLGIGMLGEQPDRLVQGGGGGVVKRRWFQRRPPECALPMLLPARTRRHVHQPRKVALMLVWCTYPRA